MTEHSKFPSIPRLSRNVIVTEKLDGTCSCIHIDQDNNFLVGSKNRWITPNDDNFGFARWAESNKSQLISELGVGTHWGEWFGQGIQRGYGLTEKRFALFNVTRWRDKPLTLCEVVPIVWEGIFDTGMIDSVLRVLERDGSKAVPSYRNPEGIVIYHEAGNILFKKTLENDGHKTAKPQFFNNTAISTPDIGIKMPELSLR